MMNTTPTRGLSLIHQGVTGKCGTVRGSFQSSTREHGNMDGSGLLLGLIRARPP